MCCANNVKILFLLAKIAILSIATAFFLFADFDTLQAAPPSLSGCQVLPADNIWNTPIDTLPVAENSMAFIDIIGRNTGLHPDFGSGTWDGAPIGIPITIVDSNQAMVSVAFDYNDESDPGPYPIPPNAAIEGGPGGDGDRHILMLEKDTCRLYELFNAWPEQNGSWTAGSGAIYDLNSNILRPEGWTSADAAGLPIIPGLIRHEEVAAGTINHALRFTAVQTRNTHVWPARHHASNLSGTQYPPMGQHFRLKADVDISGFSSEIQIILRAMKKYGLILADNGSNWYLSGEPNEGWNNDLLRELKQLSGNDFEAVDISSLMVDKDSGKASQSLPPHQSATTSLSWLFLLLSNSSP